MSKTTLNVIVDPIKNIEHIKQSVKNKALRKALTTASKPILDAAKGAAPKQTGALKFGLGRFVQVKGLNAFARIGVKSKYIKQTKLGPRRPIRYFHIIQKGSRYTRAQPFLETGYKPEQIKIQLGALIWQEIQAAITK